MESPATSATRQWAISYRNRGVNMKLNTKIVLSMAVTVLPLAIVVSISLVSQGATLVNLSGLGLSLVSGLAFSIWLLRSATPPPALMQDSDIKLGQVFMMMIIILVIIIIIILVIILILILIIIIIITILLLLLLVLLFVLLF